MHWRLPGVWVGCATFQYRKMQNIHMSKSSGNKMLFYLIYFINSNKQWRRYWIFFNNVQCQDQHCCSLVECLSVCSHSCAFLSTVLHMPFHGPLPVLTTTKVLFTKMATVFGHPSHTKESDSVYVAPSDSSYQSSTSRKPNSKQAWQFNCHVVTHFKMGDKQICSIKEGKEEVWGIEGPVSH